MAGTRLFTVRLWTEGDDAPEYRGQVHDVVTGAYWTFRDWSDMAAFMRSSMDEEQDGSERPDGAFE